MKPAGVENVAVDKQKPFAAVIAWTQQKERSG
jgi:hypothetical protein